MNLRNLDATFIKIPPFIYIPWFVVGKYKICVVDVTKNAFKSSAQPYTALSFLRSTPPPAPPRDKKIQPKNCRGVFFPARNFPGIAWQM